MKHCMGLASSFPRGDRGIVITVVITIALGLLAVMGCSRETTSAVEPSAGMAARSPLPQPDLPYRTREGHVLFGHYCEVCHGTEGHGDGFNSYNLDPKPQDLGDPSFQSSHTDDDLVAVISTGGGAAGLSAEMPPWSPTLSQREIGELVQYIRTLKPKADDSGTP
ncbi:MAG: cytochrome c [Thermoanaerobaculia bacterium]